MLSTKGEVGQVHLDSPSHSLRSCGLELTRKATGCGSTLDQGHREKTVSGKMEGTRVFLLKLFTKTPCLALLGVELSRTPDETQPGVSLLTSFESQSPSILISFPCAVTQANSGSARRGFLTCGRQVAEAVPPSKKADANPRSSVFDYVKTLPSICPQPPGGAGAEAPTPREAPVRAWGLGRADGRSWANRSEAFLHFRAAFGWQSFLS